MNRNHIVSKIQKTETFDITIIGGGATGLGLAIDAASRGYKTVLFEAFDFAKGTSSRSTKLVHGGVRYLAQGDVGMVYEALRERDLLARNAAHLVSSQPFVIPNYTTLDNYWYATGLKIYNWMSRSLKLGKTKMLNTKETVEMLPTLKTDQLKGGVLYFDGQFDDARLAINLAQTAYENGALLLNHCKVTALEKGKNNGKLKGVTVKDDISGEEFNVKSTVVVNATGVFIDDILEMDEAGQPKSIIPSQGVHIVVEKEFLPSDYALMIPKTSDGRVLFAVPWHNKLIIGTTDTKVEQPAIEPRALEEEVQFILDNVNEYLDKNLTRENVLAVFAGLRPLAAPKEKGKDTKEISRGHKILISDSGLVTISGGKWTTYRKIAEDTIDKVIRAHKLPDADCVTEQLSIHGNISSKSPFQNDPLHFYGADLIEIQTLMRESGMSEKIHKNYPFVCAQIIWAVRQEMAQTVEDFLARRVRLLFLDANAAIEAAPIVAKHMAKELGKNQDWIDDQIQQFTALAKGYLLK